MMVKFLIVAVILFILYKMFTNDTKRRSKTKQEEQERKIRTGEMVMDPICKAYVTKTTGFSVKNGEERIYFCSPDCRDVYLKQIGYTRDE